MSITKEKLDEYTKAYSQGKPEISDEEFDQLLEEYLDEHGGESSRPFLRSKQSSAVQEIVGTLPKVYGVVTPMRPGQKTYTGWLKTKGLTSKDIVCVQPKYDGCSIAYDVKNGKFFTRGDYDNGESVDVTELFINRIDDDRAIAYARYIGADSIKFEAILRHKVFETFELDKKYLRPRDAVAATITSRNVESAKYITFVPLRIYKDGKQYMPNIDIGAFYTNSDDLSGISNFIDELLKNNATPTAGKFKDDVSVDGCVVSKTNSSTNSFDTAVNLNDSTCITAIDPENEVAIKILNNVKSTRLLNVEFQVGKGGKLTPVALVDPVMFDNITVSRVTLSTFERVSSMNLRHNDTVRIMYNIVPYLIDSAHDGNYPIQMPLNCPICGYKLDLSTLKTVRCTNPNCDGKKLGSIIRYAEKMKMMGISKGVLTRLYGEYIIQSISDLYRDDLEKEISELDGFGEVSAKNIYNSIRNNSVDVPVARWLGALPFENIDSKKWDLLLRSLGYHELDAGNCIKEAVTCGDPHKFINDILIPMRSKINGIGDATIRAMHEGWMQNYDEMQKIINHVSFRITTVLHDEKTKGRVTLTRTRDAKLIEHLSSLGYEIGDWSESKTTVLVVPDKEYVSSKVVKAKAKGVPIYTVDEAFDKLT
jgi:NAD-dependent DNA ligase